MFKKWESDVQFWRKYLVRISVGNTARAISEADALTFV